MEDSNKKKEKGKDRIEIKKEYIEDELDDLDKDENYSGR